MTLADLPAFLALVGSILLVAAGTFLALRGLFRLLDRYVGALAWCLITSRIFRGRR